MPEPRNTLVKSLASGAIIGPLTFIVSWVAGSSALEGYDPFRDAISRLAAVGAPTAWMLNTGLLVYGVGVGLASLAFHRIVGRGAAIALGINAVLTFGVLATPLDRSEAVDQLHGVFAGGAYVALAAASLLAAIELRTRGQSTAARVSAVVSAVTAASLLATSVSEFSGFFQRLGLTVSDLWMMAIAFLAIRRPTPTVNRSPVSPGRR